MCEKLTLGSLFSGLGAFELAATRLGITPIWASEVEPFPIAVTRKHYPNMLHLGDINKIDGAKIPAVDIITGGFCCQDLSIAGKQIGLHGERSGLFFQMTRIIREMMAATNNALPRALIFENVPGLLSSSKGADFREVMDEIASLGFIADANILDAQEFGVAQRRKRVFIACLNRKYYDSAKYANVPNCRNKRMQNALDLWGGETFSGIASRPHEICRQHLSEILEHDVDKRFYLTVAACLGILRRVDAKGKEIPQLLRSALECQAGIFVSNPTNDDILSFEPGATARLQNGKYWSGIAPTLRSDPGDNLCSVAIPIDSRNATRSGGEQGVGIGTDGDSAYTITAERQGGVFAYSNHSADSRYEEIKDGVFPTVTKTFGSGGNNVHYVLNQREQAMTVSEDIANTQSASQYKGAQAVCVQSTIIGRKPENGANGKGVNEDLSFTLTETDRHAVCYQDTAPTLDTGLAHQNSNQIMMTGGAVVEEVYSLTTGGFPQVNEGKAPTIMSRDFKSAPVINTPSFGLDRASYNMSNKALYKPQIDEEFTHSLTAQGPNAVAQPVATNYVVRRLTPTECLVLMGLPRDYADDIGIAEPTAEDLAFWTEVFETHRLINSTSKKPKTEKQIRKWLKNPYSDSACYRAAGNGLVSNVAEFVLRGIVQSAQ